MLIDPKEKRIVTSRAHQRAVARKHKKLQATDLLVYVFNNPGQTVNEIAQTLGKTPNSIRQHLGRYRKMGYVRGERVSGGQAVNNGLQTIWLIEGMTLEGDSKK